MNKINKVIFSIKGMQVLMLNDLTLNGTAAIANGLAYEYNIDESEADITICSVPSDSKTLNVIMSIIVRFSNKYTWN